MLQLHSNTPKRSSYDYCNSFELQYQINRTTHSLAIMDSIYGNLSDGLNCNAVFKPGHAPDFGFDAGGQQLARPFMLTCLLQKFRVQPIGSTLRELPELSELLQVPSIQMSSLGVYRGTINTSRDTNVHLDLGNFVRIFDPVFNGEVGAGGGIEQKITSTLAVTNRKRFEVVPRDYKKLSEAVHVSGPTILQRLQEIRPHATRFDLLVPTELETGHVVYQGAASRRGLVDILALAQVTVDHSNDEAIGSSGVTGIKAIHFIMFTRGKKKKNDANGTSHKEFES